MVLGEFPFIVISQQGTFIKSYYLLGLTTSLLNHGCSSRLFQVADRTVMALGFFVSLYYMNDIYEVQLLSLSAFCYFMSKLTKIVYFHVLSHFLKTLTINSIMLHYC